MKVYSNLTEEEVRENFPMLVPKATGFSDMRIDHCPEALPVTGGKCNCSYSIKRIDGEKPQRAGSNK